MPARPAATHIQLNKAHFPVTVLGPGQRIGLWLQGCSIGCKGCVSQDTWPADLRRAVPIAGLIRWCRETSHDQPDGITLSGGEPFDQPEALQALLQALHGWRRQSGRDFDILCYSGYPLKTLRQRHARLLALIDLLVPEPYIDGLPGTALWRGSTNQPLVPLTPLGQARYAAHLGADAPAPARQMQVSIEGGRVWMIGIPQRGDMARIEALCASRGLSLNDVSWRR